jgi:hypothetical protein
METVINLCNEHIIAPQVSACEVSTAVDGRVVSFDKRLIAVLRRSLKTIAFPPQRNCLKVRIIWPSW